MDTTDVTQPVFGATAHQGRGGGVGGYEALTREVEQALAALRRLQRQRRGVRSPRHQEHVHAAIRRLQEAVRRRDKWDFDTRPRLGVLTRPYVPYEAWPQRVGKTVTRVAVHRVENPLHAFFLGECRFREGLRQVYTRHHVPTIAEEEAGWKPLGNTPGWFQVDDGVDEYIVPCEPE